MTNKQPSAIKITAVGDLSLNGRYEDLFDKHGAAYPCQEIISNWADADLLVGNLESPITNAKRHAPSKCTLRASSQTSDFLTKTRFCAVTLANNHVMDYGSEGMVDTIEQLDDIELKHLGAGSDPSVAEKPLVIHRKGQSIGMLSYCDVEQTSHLYANDRCGGVNRLDVEKCVADVKSLRQSADWVIVNLHWGMEMSQLPSPQQRAIAKRLVAAGADLILGHHPHVLQPMEIIDGVPVYYSLGNFLFSDMYWRGRKPDGQMFASRLRLHPLSRMTGWAEIVLNRDQPTVANFFPARLTRDLSVVADRRTKRIRQWNSLAEKLNSPNFESLWREEAKLAEARTAWRWAWKPIHRRIEMKLYWRGWLPNIAEGT